MSAREATNALQHRIFQRTGISTDFDDANTLRRAQIVLHRWAEMECGDGNGYIQREEGTGIPRYFNTRARFMSANDPRAWRRIPDREAGALRRVKDVCERLGLHYFHQTDPRGCALYVSGEAIDDTNYSGRGVACCE